MEDEEFEKYFERIEYVFEILVDDFYLNTEGRKKQLKQILEEIYQKAYDDCYEDFRTGKNLLVR